MKEPYYKFVLNNGVRLILVPMAGIESMATAVLVGAGSRCETPKISGISHFLEHMAFKGTKKFPTTDDVNVVERQGGLQNAWTDYDNTSYHNKVLASDWKLGLEVNKELALFPRLEQKYIDKERDVIVQELRRYEDEPEIKVEETFHQMMYPNTPLGMKIIGEESSLTRTQATTLHQYHDAHYSPDQIVVALAGKMETYHLSSIRYQVEQWFGDLKSTVDKGFEKATDNQKKPKLAVVTKPDAQQAHLMLGVRTFSRGSEDRFAWNVFNLLMGISFTSRLFKEIREKRGLCYRVSSSSSNWAEVGYWTVYAGVATEKVRDAAKAILAEFAKATEKGVTEEEVAVAKKRIKTMLAFKAEDPEFLNTYYGHLELFGVGLPVPQYLARIEAVTKEEVDGLARKYLRPETLNMALVWNKPQDEKLQEVLKF